MVLETSIYNENNSSSSQLRQILIFTNLDPEGLLILMIPFDVVATLRNDEELKIFLYITIANLKLSQLILTLFWFHCFFIRMFIPEQSSDVSEWKTSI